MKVLYITNKDDKYGGAQCLMELMDSIREYDDIEVVLLNPEKNNFNSWCSERKIENYSIKYCGQMYCKHNGGIVFLVKYLSYFFRYFFLNPFAIRKIEKTIDIKSFDLIHTNTSTVDIGMILAKRNGIKHVWHLREFGKEDMHFIPFRPDCYERMNREGGSFIAISEVIKKAWIKKGIDEDKITRLYDGVKADSISRNEKPFAEDKIKIAFCGSITGFKDQEQLIRAFCLLPDEDKKSFKVDFWGTGNPEYMKHLQDLIEQNHMKSIFTFKGYSNNLYQELSHYDIGMNCSHSEAFGRVTAEYMLAGLLTVASDTGANVELIQHEKTGLIFKKSDDQSLKKCLSWILKNKSKCVELAENGAIFARKNYAIEKNIEQFYTFYEDVLKNDKRRR